MRISTPHTAAFRISALMLTGLLTSCSFLGLDDIERVRCNDPGIDPAEACATALNSSNGFGAECRPWICDEAGECQLSATEICDQLDNDCDGVIDEELVDYVPQYSTPIDYTQGRMTSMMVADSGEVGRLYWTTRGREAFTLDLAEEATVGKIDYQRNINPNGIAATSGVEEGCWSVQYSTGAPDALPPRVVPSICNTAALAVGRGDDGIAAAINTLACEHGQLRIGRMTVEGELEVYGPLGRSNTFLGSSQGACAASDPIRCAALQAEVSLEATECTPGCDNSEERCIGGGCVPIQCDDGQCGRGSCICGECYSDIEAQVLSACGVSAVNVTSASRTDGSEALVAVTTGSTSVGADCDLERDVLVYRTHSTDRSDASFVTADAQGQAQNIGRTHSDSAPALASTGGSFLVVFPDLENRLSLHLLRELAPRPGFEFLECDNLMPSEQMCERTTRVPLCTETACGRDVGVCRSGAPTCFRGVAVCEGIIAGGDEICGNGLDDDCDGVVDEGGLCAEVCSSDTEVCNAIDDDCDGRVDEEVGGSPCGSDVGVCEMGSEECRGGQMICMGEVGPYLDHLGAGAPVELGVSAGGTYGAGVDDDCDGFVDERMSAEAPVACVPSGPERCDDVDSDCDGVIDEEVRVAPFDQTNRPLNVVQQCLQSEPLAPEALPPLEGLGQGVIDGVAIRSVVRRNDSIVVGMTWRETGPGGGTLIAYQQLEFAYECYCAMGGICDSSCRDPRDGIGEFRGATDPVSLTPLGQYSKPSITYHSEGLLVAGTARSEREVTATGGFFVAWSEQIDGSINQRRLFVRGLAEHDGRPLDLECQTGCARELTVLGGQQIVHHAQVYASPEGPRFVYLEESQGQLVHGSLFCPGL